jgi:hypothetical protein
MNAYGIIKSVTHHAIQDLCCLCFDVGIIFVQHKKNPMNLIHNDSSDIPIILEQQTILKFITQWLNAQRLKKPMKR